MNKLKFFVHLVYAISLITLSVFPPYYGKDIASNGKIHCFLGYYAIWDKPTSNIVYNKLVDEGKVDEGLIPDQNFERMQDFVTEFNKVRYIFNLIILSFGYLILLVFVNLIKKKLNINRI